ncbi:ATP-binding protein [Paracoccus sp. (in: a-proteobacteria)]|uniref:ATP-binding protein n=1 Tax=Paracoccus sp. TaxID=267 RepID=UPI0026DFC363|nr:ATP-binding protein [Paracoccus sp. (in: a-proteobacteria)]MDO5646656.1 ATP-binding protein [Paracoccus sp. (in: a-proteobacteria)]
MAHWDDRAGVPRSALVAVPFLMIPALLGAILLLILPGWRAGMPLIIGGTVAVAWYLLGGAISVAHLMRRANGRRTLRRIRAEVAQVSEPIWICDNDGRVLYHNTAAYDRFGPMQGQAIARMVGTLRADAQGEVESLLNRAGPVGHAELHLADGDVISVTRASDAPLQIWSCQRHDQVPDPHMVAALIDRSAPSGDFDAIPVPLLRVSSDGAIRAANNAAQRLLFDDPQVDELPHLGTLFEGPGRPVADWLADIAAGRAQNRAEMLRKRGPERRGGEQHQYYQVALAPDPTDDGQMLAVLTDASALKTMEAQFTQGQKMQAIGQLAGGVAHDFNNLLTAIGGHCDLLMLRRDKGDPDYADLDQISQNANRAAALVGQLLAFSRKQTLRLEVINLRDTVSDLTHLLNRLVGERVGLNVSFDPALHPIRADKRQLEQVIMNLVVNARDAMPKGGDITLRTENLSLSAPMLRDNAHLPAGDYVCIRVTDNGTGIDPEVLTKIFDPFFTTKRAGEGTGLGLSTAYGIVKQTGGYIFCDSTLGQGTSFSVIFPARPGEIETPVVVNSAPTAQVQPETATILLVEDEAPVRAFAVRALRLKGYDVLEAENAEAALDLLRDPKLRVDLFVTDVVMPGLDGPSWVRAALRDRPGVKVIFMSGYAEDMFGENHVPVQGASFMPKPFTLSELTARVAAKLAGNDA